MDSSQEEAAATAAGGADDGFTDDDIVNILVSTDNHIGFMERDPVRGHDSFLAFEEVLSTARDRNVDLVLLAGDLFHENKPSRYTVYRTMEILRKYVMGYNPVRVQIIGDQSVHFGGGSSTGEGVDSAVAAAARVRTFNRVNWEDPHFNIDMPVFSIHGNHDDPSREGDEVLAALDILSIANLVNYFGKADSADSITLSPLRLVKNKTKVALYGLGSVREERFQRMLVDKHVKFIRPSETPEAWFNVFMIHQNRDNRGLRTRSGNTGAEACLPRFLDLVIWGHEHECHTEVVKSGHPEAETYVLQPGSTVATSLCEGEAAPKHSFMLQVRGSMFRATPIPLRCVRPFKMRTIELAAHVSADAPDVDTAVSDLLRSTVADMIEEIDADVSAMPEASAPPVSMVRPLIRLKVEYTGFRLLSNARFGSSFADRVANPSDILLFHRRPATRAAKNKAGASGAASTDGAAAPRVPAEITVQRLEDLVAEQLHAQKMSLLDEYKLNRSLKKFVEGEADAIRTSIDETLRAHQKAASKRKVGTSAELVAYFEEQRTAAANESHEDDEAADASEAVARALADEDTAASAAPKPGRARASAATAGIADEDDDNELMAAPIVRGAAAKGRARADDDDIIDLADDDPPPTRGGRAKAAAAKPRATSRATKSRKVGNDDDDDDARVEEDDDDDGAPKARRGSTSRARGASRAVAGTKRPRARAADDDSFDDDDAPASAARAAKKPKATASAAAPRASASASSSRASTSVQRKLPWQ